MTIYEDLERRGLIAQMTHPEEIKRKLENEKVVFYIGFDPTADCLHVGHFMQVIIMMYMSLRTRQKPGLKRHPNAVAFVLRGDSYMTSPIPESAAEKPTSTRPSAGTTP